MSAPEGFDPSGDPAYVLARLALDMSVSQYERVARFVALTGQMRASDGLWGDAAAEHERLRDELATRVEWGLVD